jgi:hypothetical protein
MIINIIAMNAFAHTPIYTPTRKPSLGWEAEVLDIVHRRPQVLCLYQIPHTDVPLHSGGNNMKPNEGCALEKLVDGHWLPVALRYQRFTTEERRALDRGAEVRRDDAAWRRWDWAERQALAYCALPKY